MLTFTVNEQQADQILNALGQRPYIESAGLIGVLMQQAQQQQQAANQPQTGQAILGGARVAAQAQGQQKQELPVEPAPEVPQAVNGLDQRV